MEGTWKASKEQCLRNANLHGVMAARYERDAAVSTMGRETYLRWARERREKQAYWLRRAEHWEAYNALEA